METKILKLSENSEYSLLVYSIHDDFTKKQTSIEFCLVPNKLYYDAIDYLFFLKVTNTVLSLWFERPTKGTQGTHTFINHEILNARIVEPTDKFIRAKNIFSEESPYIHGSFELINVIYNEHSEFIALDARFTFGTFGKLIYQIGRK